MTDRERINAALEYAARYAGYDGAHHKDWVIDQMVRALTGCPMIQETAKDVNDDTYTYLAQGKSQEYKELIAAIKFGADGADTFDWNEGIPP